MRKKTFLSICMFLIGGIVNAQGVLEVSNISQPNDVFSSENDEAAVIIRCHESIPLSFVSSMDKTADPFKVDLEGTDLVYYISFPTGSRYRGRELKIIARGYTPKYIYLELQPKQLLTYQITDPNALVDAGCYREHRNKGMQELKNSNYEEARNQFIVARACSDVDTLENEKNISQADSLIKYRAKAKAAYESRDDKTARELYTKILEQNPYDTYAKNFLDLSDSRFSQDCKKIFNDAEYYYSEGDYVKARDLYKQVIAKECSDNIDVAAIRLNAITSLTRDKTDHSRVLTYEYMKDAPIGFSYGKYNTYKLHRVGGFFQMDLNTKVFEALRKNCKYGDTKFPELNVAFGWTVKIANPIWIHFGPGFTGKMYYGTYLDNSYPKIGYGEKDILDTKKMGEDLTIPKEEAPSNYKDGWTKANLAFAISPVIGITVKYSYVVLRISYQYRWSVQTKLKDFMETNRLYIGAGIAF